MPKRTIIERKHRLSPENYIGRKTIAFTCTVKDHIPLFNNNEAYTKYEHLLLEALLVHNCDAAVYLFMPDHFHFILTGKSDNVNIKKCLDYFKQKAGYWLSKNIPQVKLQKNYYDHIIRDQEDLQNQIIYILNNPVRKGIVENWKMYDKKGSTVNDLEEWEERF